MDHGHNAIHCASRTFTFAPACFLIVFGFALGSGRVPPSTVMGQEATAGADEAAPQPAADLPAAAKLPEPKGAQRLTPEYDVWLDPKQGVVIIDGQISLREGMLEMFACTRNTKEHESIVSANTKAFLVHAALLRLGAEPGTPVQFVPEYQPPTGTEIEITVEWQDEAGAKKTARAQDWVQNMKTKEAMPHPFVFAGSRFWTDPESGKQYYQAEGGDFICVSNFSTAVLDIPVPSSQSNEELAFQAFTERIPPLGAPVRLVLKPKLDEGRGARGEERRRRAECRRGSEGISFWGVKRETVILVARSSLLAARRSPLATHPTLDSRIPAD